MSRTCVHADMVNSFGDSPFSIANRAIGVAEICSPPSRSHRQIRLDERKPRRSLRQHGVGRLDRNAGQIAHEFAHQVKVRRTDVRRTLHGAAEGRSDRCRIAIEGGKQRPCEVGRVHHVVVDHAELLHQRIGGLEMQQRLVPIAEERTNECTDGVQSRDRDRLELRRLGNQPIEPFEGAGEVAE